MGRSGWRWGLRQPVPVQVEASVDDTASPPLAPVAWYEHLLLIAAVPLATVASWVVGVEFKAPDWIPYKVAYSLQLFAMGAPFAALGWALDRLGFDRVPLRVALASLPLFGLAVWWGSGMGWGWVVNGDGFLAKAADATTFTALVVFNVGYIVGIGIVGAGAGVWLSRNGNARREPSAGEEGR